MLRIDDVHSRNERYFNVWQSVSFSFVRLSVVCAERAMTPPHLNCNQSFWERVAARRRFLCKWTGDQRVVCSLRTTNCDNLLRQLDFHFSISFSCDIETIYVLTFGRSGHWQHGFVFYDLVLSPIDVGLVDSIGLLVDYHQRYWIVSGDWWYSSRHRRAYHSFISKNKIIISSLLFLPAKFIERWAHLRIRYRSTGHRNRNSRKKLWIQFVIFVLVQQPHTALAMTYSVILTCPTEIFSFIPRCWQVVNNFGRTIISTL